MNSQKIQNKNKIQNEDKLGLNEIDSVENKLSEKTLLYL